MKAPFLSTSFSENGKSAKKRFDNILGKRKKTSIIAFIIIIIIIAVVGMLVVRSKNIDYTMSNDSFLQLSSLQIGSDMATLDYADDSKVIFHYYNGLVIYNLENNKIDKVYDLSNFNVPLNTQGDIILDLRVLADGEQVLISYYGEENNEYKKNQILNLQSGKLKTINHSKDVLYFNKLQEFDYSKHPNDGSSTNFVQTEKGKKIYLLLENGVMVNHINIIVEDGSSAERCKVFPKSKTFTLVNEYIENEIKTTYKPYYEVVDVKLNNYWENYEKETGLFEATFFAEMTHKNYYKDPDTVDYIKEAKEKNSSSYQILYDEYNSEKTGNFELRITAVIKDNKITNAVLYSNVSPRGDAEWVILDNGISDFIISDN